MLPRSPTCHDGFLATLADGGALDGAAGAAPHFVLLLQHEGLVHQGGVAFEAAEAGVVPVPILEMQLLQAESTAVRRTRGFGRET